MKRSLRAGHHRPAQFLADYVEAHLRLTRQASESADVDRVRQAAAFFSSGRPRRPIGTALSTTGGFSPEVRESNKKERPERAPPPLYRELQNLRDPLHFE